MDREQILEILKLMLDQFESDPPDTEFQEGYRSALWEVRRCVLAADDSAGSDLPQVGQIWPSPRPHSAANTIIGVGARVAHGHVLRGQNDRQA